MAVGRISWACFSGLIPSCWPVLCVNILCCVGSSVLFFQKSYGMLWIGALGIGAGVSSSCAARSTRRPPPAARRPPPAARP